VQSVDTVADRVDRACPVLVRDDLGKRELPAARLPVGRIDAGNPHGDANLTRSRLGKRTLDQTKDVGPTCLRIDNCSHAFLTSAR
jgi:hypothetical protein